jgi:hypothetical protein
MSTFTLSDCETKVRQMLNDTVKTQRQFVTYNASDIITLDEDYPTAVTAVFKNDIKQSVNDWDYDDDTGKLTISFSATIGDTIEVQFTSYEKYSSSEIQNFIRRALVELSIHNYADFTVTDDDEIIYYDEDEEEEEAPEFSVQNLIAAIAVVLIKPENKSYRLPDFQVTVAASKPIYALINELISRSKRDKSGVVDLLLPYHVVEDDEE